MNGNACAARFGYTAGAARKATCTAGTFITSTTNATPTNAGTKVNIARASSGLTDEQQQRRRLPVSGVPARQRNWFGWRPAWAWGMVTGV